MTDRDVLVTGTPRSGTTLTCFLLNKLPDVVALHEPMRVKTFGELASHDAVADAVARFCAEQRTSIRTRRRAISKNLGGAVPDNPVGTRRGETGLRQREVSKGEIVIDKPLPTDFMLVIKHNSSFTAALGALSRRFPVFAVVRNPLATLASWSSVEFSVRAGYALGAERIAPDLAARLAAIDDDLDRQIALLDWFHGQYHRHLPPSSILPYEATVRSGGAALRVIHPGAAGLREPLESRNLSGLYDREAMLRMGERLLRADGAFWRSYPRESVETLLREIEGDGCGS